VKKKALISSSGDMEEAASNNALNAAIVYCKDDIKAPGHEDMT